MPYSNNAIFLDLEGGPLTSQVTVRLWSLWQVLGTGSGSGNQQSEEESMNGTIKHDDTTQMPINFNKNADFSAVSRSVGLSIQEQDKVSSNIGWLFRSGGFTGPLSTQMPIEIVAGKQSISNSEFLAMSPSTPFLADKNSSTIITSFTPTLVTNGISFTSSGTTKMTGIVVGFNYSGTMALSPSADVQAADIEALTVLVTSPSLTFTSGPSVLSSVEAAILNCLNTCIMKDYGPQLSAKMSSSVNTAIINGAGKQLTGGTLPAGIILSIRSIGVSSSGINIEAALGAFGGVLSKFPQSNTTSKCFIATAAYGNDSIEVQTLRMVRDFVLLRNYLGTKFVHFYEWASPGLANQISHNYSLKVLTRIFVVTPSFWIARLILIVTKRSVFSNKN